MKHEVDDEGMPVLRVRTFDAEAADEDSAAADDDAAMIPSPDTVSAILGFDDAFEGEKHFGFAVEKEDWGGWFHNVRVSAKATGSDFSCAQLVRMTYRKFRKAGDFFDSEHDLRHPISAWSGLGVSGRGMSRSRKEQADLGRDALYAFAAKSVSGNQARVSPSLCRRSHDCSCGHFTRRWIDGSGCRGGQPSKGGY